MKLDLAELKKRLQTRAALAISIESGRMVVDFVTSEEGKIEGTKSFVIPIGADAVVSDAGKAGLELAAHLEAAGVRERRAVVCVPASWALTTTTEVPGISAEDLRGYLELRAEREFPLSVADLRLAHCAYTLPDGEQRATLAAVPAKRMDAIDRMLEAAGCRAVSLSLGLDRCLPEADTSPAMHFVANGTHVDLVIAAGGGIAAVRSLAAPVEGAASFDARGFSREVRITLGRLPESLRQQVREARFSGTPATAEVLCSEIRPQLTQMGIDSQLQRSGSATGYPGAALGAAHQFLRRQPVAFEFLAPQVNRWEEMFHRHDSRRRRWVVAVVVAAIFLPIITFFVRSRIESSLTSEWNGMRRTVSDLESLQQQIRTFRPWFETTPQTLKVLEGVVESFPEQGEVWAKSLELGDAGKVTVTGFAKNQGVLIALLEKLRGRPEVTGVQVQQVRGENPVQFTVGFKWEGRDAK